MYQETERTRKVGALVKREVADIVLRELDDPRMRLVSITAVNVSRDLRNATVFFTMVGPGQPVAEIGEELNRLSGFIRRELGRRIRLKRTPHLDFHHDESIERGFELSRLIDSLRDPGRDT